MHALRLDAPRTWRTIDQPDPPPPGPGEAVLRVRRVGVCGTDFAGYLGTMPFFSYPRIPGHELGVEVVAVGDGVTHVKPGDRCSVEPYINCQTCHSCRRGHTNCCEHHQTLGVHCDGGLRPLVTLPARKLHPSGVLSFEQLALVETLGIGLHCVNRVNPRPEETVLVLGAGPIGLSVVAFARLAGSRVIALDRNPRRLDFVRDHYRGVETLVGTGPDADLAAVEGLTDGRWADVVVDATGSAASMSGAYRFVAFAGRLAWVGITQDPLTFTQPLLHRREMTVFASRNALAPEFTRIVRLMEAGTLDTRPWVTHRVGFDELVGRFDGLMDPAAGVVKAVVEL